MLMTAAMKATSLCTAVEIVGRALASLGDGSAELRAYARLWQLPKQALTRVGCVNGRDVPSRGSDGGGDVLSRGSCNGSDNVGDECARGGGKSGNKPLDGSGDDEPLTSVALAFVNTGEPWQWQWR